METTVLCLANSKKEGERCIAGIDVRTGQWVRPVSRHTTKGEVPFHERQIEGAEPRLLDLIRMDLAHDGPTGFDYCYSKENRWIDPSPWTREGVATAADLHHYICRGEIILHTSGKYTHPTLIEAKSLPERTTLELYEVTSLACEKAGGKWRASLTTTEGITLQEISITDCVLVERLNAEEVIEKNGYAIISLSLPWIPPIEDWNEGAVGWKLLAGWIPADEPAVEAQGSHGNDPSSASVARDEPLLTGYYLQTTPEGRSWRLYDIREQGGCRICEIKVVDNHLEMQMLTGPYEAASEHWNTGVKEQLICTNRIIETLWHQDAPQAVGDQIAAWHREDEAREFAALQRQRSLLSLREYAYKTKLDIARCTGASAAAVQLAVDQLECHEPFSLVEADRLASILTGDPSIRRAYNRTALQESRIVRREAIPAVDGVNLETEHILDGLEQFYAEEAEMERQLGGKAEVLRLDQSEVLDGAQAPEGEYLEVEAQRWLDDHYAEGNPYTAADEERDFREWMDALNERRDGAVGLSAEDRLHGGLDDFYAQEAEIERQLGAEADWTLIWSPESYRLRRLLPNKDSITLRKCLSDDELIEEYDSDYNLTQGERTLELRIERLSIHPARFLIHAEPKPHIPLDLAQLLAQIKHGHVSEDEALETFSVLRSKGFKRVDPPRRRTPSFQDFEEPASYAYDPWESSQDDDVDYGYRDDWDYSE